VPELILKAALSDQIFHDGVSPTDCHHLIDAQKIEFNICAISLEIEPRVATPGSRLEIQLTLRGDESLMQAALSNPRLELLTDGAIISSTPLMPVAALDRDHRAFHVEIDAPARAGPYSARVAVSGIPPKETIFAVIE
jgi:hypothetical protein